MRARRILAVITFGFAVAAMVFYFSTFMGHQDDGPLFAFVLLCLAFSFVAILLGRDQDDPFLAIKFPKKFPRWVERFLAVLFLFIFANVVIMLVGGTPRREGREFKKKTLSGVVLEINAEEYWKLKSAEQRLFSGFWFAMEAGLGLTLWFKDYRSKRSH